jgi:spore coat protein A
LTNHSHRCCHLGRELKKVQGKWSRRDALKASRRDALRTPVLGSDGVFPGPRIEVNQGTRALVRQRNHLPSVGPLSQPNKTSTHLHRTASLPEFDGYASDTSALGQFKDYHYPNHQAARTIWYHDQGAHWTAQQAYGDLVAMYLRRDKDESRLLPTGDFDIPLAINDAIFAADGSLAYDDNSHSGLSC